MLKEKFVELPILLLGTFRNEAIINEIYLARRAVESYNLTSSSNNWEKIIMLLENEASYSGVILNLTESILLISCNSEYQKLFISLLNCISKFPHIIFVYKDTITKKYNIFQKIYYKKYLYYEEFYNDKNIYNNLIITLNSKEFEIIKKTVATYKDEVIIEAAKKASDKQWGLIFDSYFHYIHELYKYSVDPVNPDNIPFYGTYGHDDVAYIEIQYIISNEDIYRDEIFQLREEFDDSSIEYQERERLSSEFKFVLFDKFVKLKIVSQLEEVKDAIKKINDLLDMISSMNLNIMPFTFNIDIVNTLRVFFADNETETVFKQYIYKDQLWSNELENFLSLFQEYVTKIKKVDITFEESKTDIGIIYIIKSKSKDLIQEKFNSYVDEFSEFLDYCESDLELAKAFLKNENLSAKEIDNIIVKFHKNAKRLKVDIRQDYERKMLELKHNIENEVIEISQDNFLKQYNDQINYENNDKISVIMNIGSFTQTNNKIITKTIYGDVEYSDQDNMVIDLINKYSEEKQALETELKILKDSNVDKSLKNQAGLKIRSFLAQNASKIGEVGYKLLSTYLESKLLGN